MSFSADLLEKIPQTSYLSAEHYISYRSIMRLFFGEYQKMRYQLDQESILSMLREDPHFAEYTSEDLTADLKQLVQWKNLTPIQDPHKVYTIKEFSHRQFQYMMTKEALEVERMTVTLETLYVHTAGLSSNSFRRIQSALRTAQHIDEIPQQQIFEWWQDLQEDFQRLSRNHQDYLSQFYGPAAEKQMRSVDFIVYKQQLIRYLEDFILELQSSAAQIGALLESFTPEQEEQLLELVCESELSIPRSGTEENPRRREELMSRDRGIWRSLKSWFTGDDSMANQIMDVTNEVIRTVVQNAALIVQMRNMGISNKAELRHLLTLFHRCSSLEEAHRLSAYVFGVQQARHFLVNDVLETDRIDLSAYALRPMEQELKPRTRAYKPRIDRSGFPDKSEEKTAQRQKVLEEERLLKEQVMRFVRHGELDFDTITEPVPPPVRQIFLSWIAAANLSPDGRGRTQYGQVYTFRQDKSRICRLPCTDGVLTMPHYVLLFSENGQSEEENV